MKYPGSLSYIPTERDNQDTENKVMKKDAFISEMRASYQHKFAKKPEVIDGNMQALELTYEELKDVL